MHFLGRGSMLCGMQDLTSQTGGEGLQVESISNGQSYLYTERKKAKVTQSCLTYYNPMDYTYSPWNSSGQNTEVGSLSLLQSIFPTQGSNLGLPHGRQTLYQLSHKGSPIILEWVAYAFSSRSSWPCNQTGVSCIASGFFINWAIKNQKGQSSKSF